MNTIVLIVSVATVFAFGFRFFCKFLGVAVFPDLHHGQVELSGEEKPTNFVGHITNFSYFAHHTAIICSIPTILGAAIAVYWGWVPGFLWIVTVTLVAGGTFTTGTLWLAHVQPDDPAENPLQSLLGRKAARNLVYLGFVLLSLLNILLIAGLTLILNHFPAIVLPFLLHIILLLPIRRYISSPDVRVTGLYILAALLLLLSILGLTTTYGMDIALRGTMDFQLLLFNLSLETTVLWLVPLGFLSYFLVHRPVAELAQPRAVLAFIFLMLLMVGLIIGFMITQPSMAAPAYQNQGNTFNFIPLIALIISAGAISGFHGLLAGGGNSLPGHFDSVRISRIAYSSVLIDASLGLLVLLAASSALGGQADAEKWLASHAFWRGESTIDGFLVSSIEELAAVLGLLGINLELAASFCAFVFAMLALSTLEAGIRIQTWLFDDQLAEIGWKNRTLRQQNKLVIGFLAIISGILLSQGFDVNFFILFGLANLVFATAILIALAIALMQLHRSHYFASLPLLILLILLLWSGITLLSQWFNEERWGILGVGSILVISACVLLYHALKSYIENRRHHNTQQDTTL